MRARYCCSSLRVAALPEEEGRELTLASFQVTVSPIITRTPASILFRLVLMAAKIALIGGGHMAASLIGGLLQDGHPRERLAVAALFAERADWMRKTFDIRVVPDVRQVCSNEPPVVMAGNH